MPAEGLASTRCWSEVSSFGSNSGSDQRGLDQHASVLNGVGAHVAHHGHCDLLRMNCGPYSAILWVCAGACF